MRTINSKAIISELNPYLKNLNPKDKFFVLFTIERLVNDYNGNEIGFNRLEVEFYRLGKFLRDKLGLKRICYRFRE